GDGVQVLAGRGWAWLARRGVVLVQREGDGEASADPVVSAGARAGHDRGGAGDGDEVRAGLRVDGLVVGRRDECFDEGGDAEPERPAGHAQDHLAGVRRGYLT